jgi:uroporphyrinogen III methyltransferase/synthase
MPLPLADHSIVITRARAQAESFANELEKLGATVTLCPTIEIAPPDSYERVDEAIEHLYGYDWLIFTSANGVGHFFKRFVARGHGVSELDDLRVCGIGEATAEELQALQVHVDLVPETFKAEGVFDALLQFTGGREALAGLNFLLPRAAVARDYLPQALESAGARVDVVPVYKTVVPSDVDAARLAAMLAGSADCIAFTSASSVRNLAQLFGTNDLSIVLKNIAIACIGDVTAATAVEFGLQVHIKPDQFTVPALVNAIVMYFGKV